MEANGVLSPSVSNLDEPQMVKKLLFSPFSPMAVDSENRSQHESELTTPKRRLSLNLDESTQSPLCLNNDGGYGESLSSSEECSDLVQSLNSTRSPLAELNCNGSKRKVLQAKRHNKRPTSLIYETSLKSDPAPSENSIFKIPHVSTSLNNRPSSFPSVHESWPGRTGIQGSGRSPWIRQISSPLARMSLVSPTGSSVFAFESQPSTSSTHSQSTSSTHSLTHRSSIAESDGYFSELEVFENDEISDSASDTIKSLINAPMSTGSPITFSANPENSLPCPTPVRPLPPQRWNSSSQLACTSMMKQSALKKRPSLKRSSPSSELAQLHQPKRPPLPFLHCSNSQDSPITTAAAEPSPPGRPQLKGRCLLRSQSYCMPPPDVRMTPSSPGELIGDESMPYALPLVKGSAPDLKCISPETLSKLLAGEFKDVVDSYTIIDCRYPYEYEGGHIPGAVNIWEKGDLLEKLLTNPEHPRPGQRTIYIFHCEFSSKRGPQMCRFLREVDRKKNGLDFPKLYYPELYLLEGGYKAFYHAFSDLCEPKSYCLMLDEKYKEELRHFKHRAKSWTGDPIMQSRRQVPSRCRRRTTVNFGTRPKSYSLDSRLSSPSLDQENVH